MKIEYRVLDTLLLIPTIYNQVSVFLKLNLIINYPKSYHRYLVRSSFKGTDPVDTPKTFTTPMPRNKINNSGEMWMVIDSYATKLSQLEEILALCVVVNVIY